jgi:hypothetical protein
MVRKNPASPFAITRKDRANPLPTCHTVPDVSAG